MVTKSRLKSERGWTDKLLKAFLPEPDLVKPNPNYKSGPPMQLFEEARIERIENTSQFKKQFNATIGRKQAARKAVATKMEQLRKYLEAVEISLPALPRDDLIDKACRHYNDIQWQREAEGRKTCGLLATKDSDRVFLDRICVNYLRHCLTRYESHLDKMSGKVGFGEGYREIRHKIFSKISGEYQWLASECKRQEGKSAGLESESSKEGTDGRML